MKRSPDRIAETPCRTGAAGHSNCRRPLREILSVADPVSGDQLRQTVAVSDRRAAASVLAAVIAVSGGFGVLLRVAGRAGVQDSRRRRGDLARRRDRSAYAASPRAAQDTASAHVDPDRVAGLHCSSDVGSGADQRVRPPIDLDRDRCDRNGRLRGAWQRGHEARDHCRPPAVGSACPDRPRAYLPVRSRGVCVVADGDRGDCLRREAATSDHLAGNRSRHCDRGRHAHLPGRPLVLGHGGRSVPRAQRCVCRRRTVAAPERTPTYSPPNRQKLPQTSA